MNHLESACESIDASVFSSDMLFDDERREMLKHYIGRWTRAIDAHESAPPLPGDGDELDEDDWTGSNLMGG